MPTADTIGVVLVALSAGYRYGGKRADRDPTFAGLYRTFLVYALAFAVVALLGLRRRAIVPEVETEHQYARVGENGVVDRRLRRQRLARTDRGPRRAEVRATGSLRSIVMAQPFRPMASVGRWRMWRTGVAVVAIGGLFGAGCGTREPPSTDPAAQQPNMGARSGAAATTKTPRRRRTAAGSVYAAATARRPSPRLRQIRERVYVPNSDDGTVEVINPKTYRVTARFRTGDIPHHITPAWDLRRLYVDNTGSGTLTVIDPRSGRPVRTIAVADPYNLYFTPNGREAIVVAERERRLDFRARRSFRMRASLPIPCAGPDHLDFSRTGRTLLVSCEFSGMVVKVDVRRHRVTGRVRVGGLPVDVKLAPGGRRFYVANQGRGGVSIIDPRRMREVRFLRTGRGAHGLVLSRDARRMYVSNRLAGTISVIDLRRRRVAATWRIGGSPDMGSVTADGRRLWISGRYNGAVYVVDTRTGRRLRTIAVGASPHGMTLFPAPGRYSLGHNGVYR